MAFRGVDYLCVDSLFGEEELMVRQTARRFAEERILPGIRDCYRDARFPAGLISEMADLGFLGANLEGYGCAGMSNVEYGLVMQELERVDSGVRSFVSVQGALVMYPIHRFGSEEQKSHWLPLLQSGKAIGCFGLTQPDFGSNPAGMRTRARRDGDDWVLSGTKMWITNGSGADVAGVWAQTEDRIRGFVVPTDSPGFAAPEITRKMSLRASVSSELVLEDVRLPGSAVLPGAAGLSGPLSCLNEARFGIVFGALGAARDCLEATIAYTQERQIFDRSLAAYQITQTKLADMTLELGKGMLLALHLGALKDAGELRPEQVSLGKLNNAREALAIARECRTLLGAAGITLEYPLMRHANNLESVLTYEGTSEVHQLVIGQALTGESAFR